MKLPSVSLYAEPGAQPWPGSPESRQICQRSPHAPSPIAIVCDCPSVILDAVATKPESIDCALLTGARSNMPRSSIAIGIGCPAATAAFTPWSETFDGDKRHQPSLTPFERM